LCHGNCVGEEENLRSEEMEWQWTMADPEVWNRGVAIGEGEQNLERGLSPPPKFFGKFDSKIMHFCAKFSLVLRCIRSIGGAPP